MADCRTPVAAGTPHPPSLGRVARTYLPLALSGLLMTLQQPVVTSSLARLPDATGALAAYGAALSVLVFVESPVQPVLVAANALWPDPRARFMIARLALATGCVLSALLLLVAFHPGLSRLVFRDLLGLGPRDAANALVAIRLAFPWPLLVSMRRLYQGFLIATGQASVVALATLARLATIALGAALLPKRLFAGAGLVAGALPGAAVGVLAIALGAAVEAVAVAWRYGGKLPGRPAEQLWSVRSVQAKTQVPADGINTAGALLRFYGPLALTSTVTLATWPVFTRLASAGRESSTALGAWAASLSAFWLLATPISMLEQVTVRFTAGRSLPRALVWLGLGVSAAASAILAWLVFSPTGWTAVRAVYPMTGGLSHATRSAMAWLVPAPALAAWLAVFQGFATAVGRSGAVLAGSVVGLGALQIVSVLGGSGMADGARLAAGGLVTWHVAAAGTVALVGGGPRAFFRRGGSPPGDVGRTWKPVNTG